MPTDHPKRAGSRERRQSRLSEWFAESHAKANLLHLWLMGMRELGPDEVHEAIHPVLQILRSHGSEDSTVKNLLDRLERPS